MKVALINPNIIENSPFFEYYTDVLNKNQNIDYTYITWRRNEKSVTPSLKKNYEFSLSSHITASKIKKISHYRLFINYVKDIISKENFDYIIVFTLQCGLFLHNYLKKNYNNRYIFDIRDYSPVYPFFKAKIDSLIKHSIFTTISSPGYRDWLPKEYSYTLGHNVKKDLIINAINNFSSSTSFTKSKPIKILTIGQIRDFSSNSRIIRSLYDDPDFEVFFVGDGISVASLKEIAKGSSNIHFKGRYLKKDENSIVKECDLVNIILPISLAHDTPLSNRFYLSLIHQKPMVVNKESIQAKYIREYNTGLIIESNDDISTKILNYRKNFNEKTYINGCLDLLSIIKNDIDKFEYQLQCAFQIT